MIIGTQIAGYRLEELIGRGGMGVVYRAHDLALERPVALKLLAPSLAEDPAFRERFLVESRLAASLDHPNVVPVYDAGEVEGQLYLAMRYVRAQTSSGCFKTRARWSRPAQSPSPPRWQAHSTPLTSVGSCTATSSPPTFCWTRASTPTWPTSA
jgi:hypothetical protein